MLDFVGLWSVDPNILGDDLQPFSAWREMLGRQVPVEEVAGDHIRLWMADLQACRLVDNGRVRLALQGECYARAEDVPPAQRRLSAQDLLDRFLNEGKGFVDRLKGSFNILVQDRRDHSCLLFNDPIGIRPLYYGRCQVGWCFSSSLHAMMKCKSHLGEPIKANPRALLEHFLFDFTLDDQTYVKGIREVPPGSILRLTPETSRLETYADPFDLYDLSGPVWSGSEGTNLLAHNLREQISMRTEGPENTAVALTGGFDSRCILALLGKQAAEYSFFSYGKSGSWDIDIAATISRQLGLHYQPINLEDEYARSFSSCAEQAVRLSEGRAEFTHANIAFVYGRHLKPFESLLTGLFGSELIKTPSSRGLFLDENALALLRADHPADALRPMLEQASIHTGLSPGREVVDELEAMVAEHPFINNDLPLSRKLFHYLMRIGIRQYFRKELSIQRGWKKNLAPFLDIDFIRALLKTPFPWVYNFSQKKALLRNVRIHRLYAEIINRQPQLGKIMSTHGYRPYHLLSPFRLPLLAGEFYRNKKRGRKASSLAFQKHLAEPLVTKHLPNSLPGLGALHWPELAGDNGPSRMEIKMASLNYWIQQYDLA